MSWGDWPDPVRADILGLEALQDELYEFDTSYAETWRSLRWQAEALLSDGEGGTTEYHLLMAAADVMATLGVELVSAGVKITPPNRFPKPPDPEETRV